VLVLTDHGVIVTRWVVMTTPLDVTNEIGPDWVPSGIPTSNAVLAFIAMAACTPPMTTADTLKRFVPSIRK
jgi:hypothetical protein